MFKGIVASHCFHWFANDIALQEITRVLQPNGHFVLVWIFPDTRVDWVKAVNAKAMSFKQPNEPRYCDFLWKTAIDKFPGLHLTSERVLDYTFREYTISDRLHFYSTISSFARMPKEEKENALEEVANIVESNPVTTGKDVFQFPNTVDIYQYTKQ